MVNTVRVPLIAMVAIFKALAHHTFVVITLVNKRESQRNHNRAAAHELHSPHTSQTETAPNQMTTSRSHTHWHAQQLSMVARRSPTKVRAKTIAFSSVARARNAFDSLSLSAPMYLACGGAFKVRDALKFSNSNASAAPRSIFGGGIEIPSHSASVCLSLSLCVFNSTLRDCSVLSRGSPLSFALLERDGLANRDAHSHLAALFVYILLRRDAHTSSSIKSKSLARLFSNYFVQS